MKFYCLGILVRNSIIVLFDLMNGLLYYIKNKNLKIVTLLVKMAE